MQIKTYTSYSLFEQVYKPYNKLKKLNLVLIISLLISYLILGFLMEDFFGFPLIVVPFLILFLIFLEYIYYADGKNKKKIIRDAIKKEEYTLTSFNEENIVHEVYNGEKKTIEGHYEYCDLVYREYDTYVALINKDINNGIFVYKENGVMDFLKNKNIMQIDEYKKKNKRKDKKSSV